MATRSREVSRCFQFEFQKIQRMKTFIYVLIFGGYLIFSAVYNAYKKNSPAKQVSKTAQKKQSAVADIQKETENVRPQQKVTASVEHTRKEKSANKKTITDTHQQKEKDVIKRQEITSAAINFNNVEDLQKAIITAEIINRKY